MKNHFIVGDVHGCLNTLQTLLKHWDAKTQQLIFVGDIIDHGKFSPETVAYILKIKKEYPETVIIRGNHEQLFHAHVNKNFNDDWIEKAGKQTFEQYLIADRRIEPDAELFGKLPLIYELPYLLVSHAGVSATSHPYDVENPEGVLYHRSEVINLGKLQVFGHTPQDSAIYNAENHAICIDTGAYKCNKLTGLVVNCSGEITDIYTEDTHQKDMPDCSA